MNLRFIPAFLSASAAFLASAGALNAQTREVVLVSSGAARVTFSARAIYNDPLFDGEAGLSSPAGVRATEQFSGTSYFLKVGGARPSGVAPVSGSWSPSGPQPNISTVSHNYVWEVNLGAGRWLFEAVQGVASTRFTTPAASPGDPPEVTLVPDSYHVEDLTAQAIAGGDPLNSGGTPLESSPNSTYSLTWTGAAGGAANYSGDQRGLTVVLPYSGSGSGSVTATAQSTNGGIVTRVQLVRRSTGEVLVSQDGNTGNISATASMAMGIGASDYIDARVWVDGVISTGNGSSGSAGGSFTLTGPTRLRYRTQFDVQTDTDGNCFPTRGAPVRIYASGGSLAFSADIGFGAIPSGIDSGIIENPNTTGGYTITTAPSFTSVPQTHALPTLGAGTYSWSIGFGHTTSGVGNVSRCMTIDWSPGDSSILGAVQLGDTIAAMVQRAGAPVPTPTPPPDPTPFPTPTPTPIPVSDPTPTPTPGATPFPTPTPTPTLLPTPTSTPVPRPPTISWTSPSAGPGPLAVTMYVMTNSSVGAVATDADGNLAQIFLSRPATGSVAYPAAGSSGQISVPVTQRWPMTETFRAWSVDSTGLQSAPIDLQITWVYPPATVKQLNGVFILGADSPNDAFVGRVKVQGAIIALGDAPLPGTGTGPEEFRPDEGYLTGTKWPPIVPMFTDVRIMGYSRSMATATEPAPGLTPAPGPGGPVRSSAQPAAAGVPRSGNSTSK